MPGPRRTRGAAMDVADWLRQLGLERYEAAFRENDVSAAILPGLISEDLKELGIVSVGHRRQLLAAIAELHPDSKTVDDKILPLPRSQAIEPSHGSAAERRQLSVMFCDVIDFTALSSRIDPEDLSAVIRGYQSRVATTIARFGGFIARYVGDGILIYFGWPEAHEVNAESAVRAALAVVDVIIRAPVLTEPLQVRIGIATGLVVVGEPIGTGEARQQTAIGRTPNLAARLQCAARPGCLVIDAATRRAIDSLFECQDLGPLALKGFPEKVPAWQVTTTVHRSRSEALHSAASLVPLFGRDEELSALSQFWLEAKSGKGCTVLLVGDPGIGKSRLVATLMERLTGESYQFSYFCSPQHQDSPLFPVLGAMPGQASRSQDLAEVARPG